MEINELMVISTAIYKLASLFVGYLSIYLGYKLFVKGIFHKSGNVNGNFKNNSFSIKNAAPGTFFSVFGAVIIVSTIYSGIEFESPKEGEDPDINGIGKFMLNYPKTIFVNPGNKDLEKVPYSTDTVFINDTNSKLSKNELLDLKKYISESISDMMFRENNENGKSIFKAIGYNNTPLNPLSKYDIRFSMDSLFPTIARNHKYEYDTIY